MKIIFFTCFVVLFMQYILSVSGSCRCKKDTPLKFIFQIVTHFKEVHSCGRTFITNFGVSKDGVRQISYQAELKENESPNTTTRSSRTCSNRSGIIDFTERNGRKTGSQSEFKFAKGNGSGGHETITAMSTKSYPDFTSKSAKGKVFNGDEVIVPMPTRSSVFEGHETIQVPMPTKSRAGPQFASAKGKVFNGDEIIAPMPKRSSVFEGHETIQVSTKYTKN